MLKSVRTISNYFSRTRSRRQDIPVKQSLKDLTTAQTFEKQLQKHRNKFESYIPEKTLTQTLNQSRPKLGERFKVDREDLQKKLRKVIKKELNVDRIVPLADEEAFHTLESKSHIYDQKAEIQFQQKFRNQLFKKKQTNRIIGKEKNDFRNYLEQPKNGDFVQYQQNIRKFKNSKIDSMMNFKRNNDQLRLLIDSGYIDNPQNLGIILDKMNRTPKLQNKGSVTGQQAHQIAQLFEITQSKNSQVQSKDQDLSSKTPAQIRAMHHQMMKNISGPTQLRNVGMLQQFFQKFEESNVIQKQKAKQDLQLIKEIKQFQDKAFQNRYNTLNFRFKGQVDFDWMKQTELLSYIKNQRSLDTQPQGLLKMFIENKSKFNRFRQPIITPTVMSRIYSVCSLYKFPQSDQNNRINMLNDKKYIQLEKTLFKNIQQLSDQSFADVVFGYTRNHKEEQGLLKKKMNQRITDTIFSQLNERVSSLKQEDLGLVLRSLPQTTMMKNDSFDWTNITESLSQRLQLMQKEYEFESVMTFLTLVPASDSSISAVQSNMSKFKEYKWQSKETLQSFLQSTSFLIRFQGQLPNYKQQKMIQQLKYILCSKYQQIMPITQQLSINNMPQLLSIIYCLDKARPLDVKFQIQVPNRLINKCKKQIVDNIRMQKQLIKKYTVGNLTFSMALNDYCKALISKHQTKENELPVLQISTLKSLFPFRPLPFNSINYFTYHQMTKLVNSQMTNLPVKFIVQTLFASSLVRYKNQGIMEEILGKLVQKIYYEIKQSGVDQNIIHNKYTREYALIICSFHHNRMLSQYYYHFLQRLKSCSTASLVRLQPNLLIRFFQSIVSLGFTTDQKYVQDIDIFSHFANLFQVCYKEVLKSCLSALKKDEILVLEYVSTVFDYFKIKSLRKIGLEQDITATFQQQKLQIRSHIDKFMSSLTTQDQYLRGLTKLVSQMSSGISNSNQNQIQLQRFVGQQFTPIQQIFYKRSIHEIMEQQQQIGSQFKYQTIYENIRKKLVKQNPGSTIQPKTWRIQVKDKREVYFIATYEHLLAKYQGQSASVRLFGLWKIYSELYLLKGWKFRLVCTFLEG